MKKHNLPLLDALAYDDKAKDWTCAPHVTFTTDGFFNPPHTNDEDISDYAFLIFLPTLSSDGSLISDASAYNVSLGPFVFPDHKIGTDFDGQFGVVKMVWRANQVKHCTMPSSHSSTCSRLGMQLVQINLRIANASDRYQKGKYKKVAHYFGDHLFYLYRSIGYVNIIITSLLFFIMFLF
jgi:hypothetical protein